MKEMLDSFNSMEWDFEEIKKKSKPGSTFVSYGANNPMFGLKGPLHPASSWHKNVATKEYYDNKRKKVSESWVNQEERRKQHSEKMKERWKVGKITPETSRKNGQHGLKGKDIHNSLDIEYKGVLYYGWRELKEKTNVTKHLYKKYYMNGIDPESRIGSDGPNNINMKKLDKEVSV